MQFYDVTVTFHGFRITKLRCIIRSTCDWVIFCEYLHSKPLPVQISSQETRATSMELAVVSLMLSLNNCFPMGMLIDLSIIGWDLTCNFWVTFKASMLFLCQFWYIWDNLFKDGANKIYGRYSLRGLFCFKHFLETVFHKSYLVYSWMRCLRYNDLFSLCHLHSQQKPDKEFRTQSNIS